MEIRVYEINEETAEETLVWEGSYADFRERNAEHVEELDKWDGLLRGRVGQVYCGGGAAPLYLLKRVAA